MSTIRTFIALAMPDAARRQLCRMQELIAQEVPRGVRWVGLEAMHLTVKFLGATDAQLVPAIAGALCDAVRGVPPVRFALSGLGAFPSARSPKVLWAGFVDGGDAAAVHRSVEAALEGLGYAREPRPYAPHLTLGRVRDFRVRAGLALALEHHGTCHFGEFEASRIVFFQSELRPSGAHHTVLHEKVLAPGG